ncbi:MAG TPA: TolC family protein, partial [Methylophaga sp.]|nr:TolC family protein [Methylophaga sp.]
MSTLLARASVLQTYVLEFWRIKKPLIFALLTASFATGALAQPQLPSQPLSLETALHIAEQRSQAILAQEASALASQEMAVRAKELPDPILQLSLNNLPVNGSMAYSISEDFMTMRTLGISQTFTGENKRQARANVFERKVHTAQIAKELTISQLRRETALAWFDRFYQQQMVALLEEQQKEAKLQVNASEASYRSGQGRQSDIFLAKTTVAEIQDRILQAQASLKNATTTLTRWIGDTAYTSLVQPPDITQSPIDKLHLTHQINEHPDIAVMVAQESVARAEAEVAR